MSISKIDIRIMLTAAGSELSPCRRFIIIYILHFSVFCETFGKNLIDLRNKFAINPDHKKHYIE